MSFENSPFHRLFRSLDLLYSDRLQQGVAQCFAVNKIYRCKAKGSTQCTPDVLLGGDNSTHRTVHNSPL